MWIPKRQAFNDPDLPAQSPSYTYVPMKLEGKKELTGLLLTCGGDRDNSAFCKWKLITLASLSRQVVRMPTCPLSCLWRNCSRNKERNKIVGGGSPMVHMLHIRYGHYQLPLPLLHGHLTTQGDGLPDSSLMLSALLLLWLIWLQYVLTIHTLWMLKLQLSLQ